MDILETLNSHILKVYDENDQEIIFRKKEIKFFKAKYSSAGKESITLFLDDIPLKNIKKKKYKVLFKCLCGEENKILLSKYLLKKKLNCVHCREDEEKKEWHRLFFKLQKEGKERGWKKRKKRDYDFEKENNEFKKDYFEKNLTTDEFNLVKKYIYSIDNIIVEGTDYEFLIAEPSYNAKKYTQKVLIDGKKHSLRDVCLRCPLCDEIYHVTRPLKEKVLSHNFDCRKCNFSYKTFAVKKYSDHLTYQGQLEFNFIERCVKNNIKIINGDSIDYFFDGTFHTYTIDFKLPDLKCLIETKDNHIWHKRQVESGKWTAKENAAIEYAKNKDMKYYLLFPKDIDKFFEPYERDSQISIER